MKSEDDVDVVVVGGGFTGLSAAYEISKAGHSVTLMEATTEVGGLASTFEVAGQRLERFYHHWFTNDHFAMNLIEELELGHALQINPTNTGMYYANSFYKLSTPWDLLKFKPLILRDRIRLGLLALRARKVRDWTALEQKTAAEWLKQLGGEEVYRVVWEPLLVGKFGEYAEQVSAVWFWNKLKLRGGSRGKGGEERLAYLDGGFTILAETLADKIKGQGGEIKLSCPVSRIEPNGDKWIVVTERGLVSSKRVIATSALPLIADMVSDWAPSEYLAELRAIKYIGNVCLVLELDRALSDTYWLNVNDPTFPFVGVIEHTNFERIETYGGRHIVYLSKYLPHDAPLYLMEAEEVLAFAIPHLTRMFPEFDRDWVLGYHVWRARWAQPVVECGYGAMIPSEDGPRKGLHVCSMAQIYPEDRGTNYAIRNGRAIGRRICGEFCEDNNGG